MIETMIASAAAKKLLENASASTLMDSVWDGIVDFMADQAKILGQKEALERISRLRSDAKIRQEIQAAIERAVVRWSDDYHDRELVTAVAENTTFADLPSVQQAARGVAQRPYDPEIIRTLEMSFGDVLPSRFEKHRVEAGVSAFLEVLQEEFAGIAALRDALRIFAALETSRHTGALPQILAALERLEKGPTPTEATLHKYLSWVIDQHRYLDPRGTMQTSRQVQVPLAEIFVTLDAEIEPLLATTDRRIYEKELEELMRREDLRPEEKEDLRENLLAGYLRDAQTNSSQEKVELGQLVNDYPILVILGDPGAGKTTVLRYLGLMHAQGLRCGSQQVAELGQPARLPIYMRIANYAEYGHGRSLIDYVPDNVCGDQHSDPALPRLIRDALAQGSCQVLLDGLDEVIEPNQRAEIANQIDLFIRQHKSAGNRFVVTSRVAGYRSAPLSGEIPHYRVRDMSEEQILRFLRQWCHAVERFQTPDLSPEAQAEKAQGEIDGILKAIAGNTGVRRLATNPLLLRILALIHRTGARLPQKRIELYRLAADTLIRDWRLSQGVPEAALVNESEANRLLAELAAWLHAEKPAGIATEGEVRACLAEVKGHLMGLEPDHPDVEAAMTDFLQRIRQHTGLFVVRAPRRYGFMHLTFEEYFAARWLVAKPKEAARRIRNKLHRHRWEEPILLAIGFYGMEFPDDVDELVREAILGEDLGGPSPYEYILHRDLIFAIRLQADQDVSPSLRRKLGREFANVWLDLVLAESDSPLSDIIEKTFNLLAGPAKSTIIDELIARLKSTSEDIQSAAIRALSQAADIPDVKAALLDVLTDSRDQIRFAAASALRNITDEPRVIETRLAALGAPNELDRAKAVASLANATNEPRVINALQVALGDPNDLVRSSASMVLWNAKNEPRVIDTLLVALGNPNPDVRVSAARALNNATSAYRVLEALAESLSDPNVGVRREAAIALRNAIGEPWVIDALLEALGDPNETVRRAAAEALRKASDEPRVLEILLEALGDPNDTVRRAVARVIEDATDKPWVLETLLTAIADPSEALRSAAVQALSKAWDEPRVLEALLEALGDPSDVVRRAAVEALKKQTDEPRVLEVVLAALSDPSDSVRCAAVDALRKQTDEPRVIEALLASLADSNDGVRSTAATVLENEIDKPRVIQALLIALTDPSDQVRKAAAYSLKPFGHRVDVVFAMLKWMEDIADEPERFDYEHEYPVYFAAFVLLDAEPQPEILNRLLKLYMKGNESVKSAAIFAIRELVKKPRAGVDEEFKRTIRSSFDDPNIHEVGISLLEYEKNRRSWAKGLYPNLFETLAAITPGPTVN